METKVKLPPIYGFNECSEAGDNIFAPSIFLGGCNLRCDYCMNSKLIEMDVTDRYLNDVKLEAIPIQKIKSYVKKDKSEWLMISGGEPTFLNDWPALLKLISEIKSWGCKVGLSTNGHFPYRLYYLLNQLDYVALDLKQSTWIETEVLNSKISLMLTKKEKPDFNYEIRTTLFPKYISERSLHRIGCLIKDGETWVLQQYRVTKDMPLMRREDYTKKEKKFMLKPYSEKKLQELLKIAQLYTKNARLRYV